MSKPVSSFLFRTPDSAQGAFCVYLWKGSPLSAHDQQTLCDISLLVWRCTSASPSQAVSLS